MQPAPKFMCSVRGYPLAVVGVLTNKVSHCIVSPIGSLLAKTPNNGEAHLVLTAF